MDQDKYKEIEAELKTRFGLLPQEIQDSINSSEYQTKLFELAKKYKWTYEQLGTLEMETTLVLLGMTPPEIYQDELAKEVGKKTADIKDMVEEIKQQVFTPIREALMQVYHKDDGSDDDAGSAVVGAEKLGKNEENVLAKSGISLNSSTPGQTSSQAVTTENRSDMLKDIENPPKTEATVLNETGGKQTVRTLPAEKPQGAVIPVPRAPYAAMPQAPSVDAIKAPAPSVSMPPKTVPVMDSIAGKLSGTVIAPTKETDHTLKPAVQASGAGDSYREPIE